MSTSIDTQVFQQTPQSGSYPVNGIVPIGGIIPFLLNLTEPALAIPYGFMLCDGSEVDDPNSPLDGVTIPDLNGTKAVLRSADASAAAATDTLDIVAEENPVYDVVMLIRYI